MSRRLLAAILLTSTAALAVPSTAQPVRLATGVTLDPAAPPHATGRMPLATAISPEGSRAAVLLCGWYEQGVQVMDLKTGAVLQTLPQPAAFIGLAFSPDGKTLWASGGDDDSLFRYAWRDGAATLEARVELMVKSDPKASGISYPAGLAISRDGKRLYVAENLGDALLVLDTATNAIVQRLDTDRYPYSVTLGVHGEVYVSCWGANDVNVFRPRPDGTLHTGRRIEAVRHPSAMTLSRDGKRLFVASASSDTIGIIDTALAKLVGRISDAPPAGPHEGSTPNALALSPDSKRLFVAEADNNAVAVIDLATRHVAGRIPVDWYPSALDVRGNDLVVVNAKGHGSGPNPTRPQPTQSVPNGTPAYTLGQLHGSLMTLDTRTSGAALQELTTRVTKANNWTGITRAAASHYPPFKHVIYILKENRTYDQVFGDMTAGDGDPSLLFFGPESSPNHHALAGRFGLFDRFFTNAEVSAQGHNWSTAAYSGDYVEKTMPSVYSDKGRDYDYEGSNRQRGVDDDDDVASPSTGYLWDLAARKGITYRNYGNFIGGPKDIHEAHVRPLKQALVNHTNLDYPGFDVAIRDQQRLDIWMKDFREFVDKKSMPALQLVWLPNDHTAGAAADRPTPRAYMADNDLALGRMVEAVSTSDFWRDTVIFVMEDDAQSGPDHVDSHRSPLLVISAYNRPATIHRFANTTDALATMEEILGLGALSKFDHYGNPLRSVFAATPDLTPYHALTPEVPLDEKNPPATEGAKKSAQLDLSREDADDDDTFNRILWAAIKGDATPYPGSRRAGVGELGK
jgi:YVTN family beta-propeller protein